MSKIQHYKLEGKNPVFTSPEEWSRSRQDGKIINIIHQDEIDVEDKHYIVSTIFLGLELGYKGEFPLLFETMAFQGDDWENYQDIEFRYTTYDLAEEGHYRVVDYIRSMVTREQLYEWYNAI